MKQRLWPVTGSTSDELRQAAIDDVVQRTLARSYIEPAESLPTQTTEKHRERWIENLFITAAAEAERR